MIGLKCQPVGSIPGQSTWDLWWIKESCSDRVFSEYFGYPLSVSFDLCSILIYSSIPDAICLILAVDNFS